MGRNFSPTTLNANDPNGNAYYPPVAFASVWTSALWQEVIRTIVGSVVTKTANYTVVATDDVILVDATSGPVTITLLSAVEAGTNKVRPSFTIKKIDSSANAVTIATTSSQTIDGATSVIILFQNTSVDVRSDGSNWRRF